MDASDVIECIYEKGVFKPLEDVKIKDGTRLRIKLENKDLSKYRGILGKASADRLQE